jgi:uncharacterized membrane protein
MSASVWILILLDALILGLALIFRLARPKEINVVYGFRTKLSMKNEHTWRVANTYWTNLNLVGSVFVLMFQGVLALLGKPLEGLIAGTCVAWVIMLIASLILTQRVLTKTFDKDGNWR